MHKFDIPQFNENDEREVYFLTGFNDCVIIPFHINYGAKVDDVCGLYRGDECCYLCEDDLVGGTRDRYGFYFYDYKTRKISILITLESEFSVLPVLCELAKNFDDNEIKGRSFVLDRVGKTKNTKFYGRVSERAPEFNEIDVTELEYATQENLEANVFEFFEGLALKR